MMRKYIENYRFVLCWNYKVLKQLKVIADSKEGFVLCWNYKVLKQIGDGDYEIGELCTLLKLQGSQAHFT